MMRRIFLARAFDGRWISIDISVHEYATERPSKLPANHSRTITYKPITPAARGPHVRSRDNSSHYRTLHPGGWRRRVLQPGVFVFPQHPALSRKPCRPRKKQSRCVTPAPQKRKTDHPPRAGPPHAKNFVELSDRDTQALAPQHRKKPRATPNQQQNHRRLRRPHRRPRKRYAARSYRQVRIVR